jgi:hypothetical protein
MEADNQSGTSIIRIKIVNIVIESKPYVKITGTKRRRRQTLR